MFASTRSFVRKQDTVDISGTTRDPHTSVAQAPETRHVSVVTDQGLFVIGDEAPRGPAIKAALPRVPEESLLSNMIEKRLAGYLGERLFKEDESTLMIQLHMGTPVFVQSAWSPLRVGKRKGPLVAVALTDGTVMLYEYISSSIMVELKEFCNISKSFLFRMSVGDFEIISPFGSPKKPTISMMDHFVKYPSFGRPYVAFAPNAVNAFLNDPVVDGKDNRDRGVALFAAVYERIVTVWGISALGKPRLLLASLAAEEECEAIPTCAALRKVWHDGKKGLQSALAYGLSDGRVFYWHLCLADDMLSLSAEASQINTHTDVACVSCAFDANGMLGATVGSEILFWDGNKCVEPVVDVAPAASDDEVEGPSSSEKKSTTPRGGVTELDLDGGGEGGRTLTSEHIAHIVPAGDGLLSVTRSQRVVRWRGGRGTTEFDWDASMRGIAASAHGCQLAVLQPTVGNHISGQKMKLCLMYLHQNPWRFAVPALATKLTSLQEHPLVAAFPAFCLDDVLRCVQRAVNDIGIAGAQPVRTLVDVLGGKATDDDALASLATVATQTAILGEKMHPSIALAVAQLKNALQSMSVSEKEGGVLVVDGHELALQPPPAPSTEKPAAKMLSAYWDKKLLPKSPREMPEHLKKWRDGGFKLLTCKTKCPVCDEVASPDEAFRNVLCKNHTVPLCSRSMKPLFEESVSVCSSCNRHCTFDNTDRSCHSEAICPWCAHATVPLLLDFVA